MVIWVECLCCREDKEMTVHQVSMESRETQANLGAKVPREQMDKRWDPHVLCLKIPS